MHANAGVIALALFVAGALSGALVLVAAAGALIFLVGLRIAYDHRGAGRRHLAGPFGWQPRFLPSLTPEWKRVIDGTVIAAFGTILAGIALISEFR